jgi:hypothetical protein
MITLTWTGPREHTPAEDDAPGLGLRFTQDGVAPVFGGFFPFTGWRSSPALASLRFDAAGNSQYVGQVT